MPTTEPRKILQSNFDKLSALADSLLTNEVIFREDVERILGERPFQKPETALPSPEAAAAPEAEKTRRKSPETRPIAPPKVRRRALLKARPNEWLDGRLLRRFSPCG